MWKLLFIFDVEIASGQIVGLDQSTFAKIVCSKLDLASLLQLFGRNKSASFSLQFVQLQKLQLHRVSRRCREGCLVRT